MRNERESRRPRRLLRLAYHTALILGIAFVFSVTEIPSVPTADATNDPAVASDLWVDAAQGHDANDGRSPSTPLRTIQQAAYWAQPGTTVHILPGVYRESVRPAASGRADAPVVYLAEEGASSVVIRGSEASSALTWRRLTQDPIGLPDGVDPSNLFYADLSSWHLTDTPRFVVELGGPDTEPVRLPLAREPDWYVATDWRYHELWWTADGGSHVAQCNPSSPQADWNCDQLSRCANQLTDRNAYPEPDARIEPGSLATLRDLTGARLVAMDAKWGHYVYARRIVDHDVAAGTITVDRQCHQDGGASDPGLGWGSKYYVEDHPALLDAPGEWWYDATTGRIYLWPRVPKHPAQLSIEISRRANGFDLTGRSHITLDGLTIEFTNQDAVKQGWGSASSGNTIRNASLRFANYGVGVRHSGPGVTRDFTLQNSELAHIDTNALFISEWWDGAPTPTTGWQPSTENIVIRGNEFHHIGFRADAENAVGVKIQFANKLRFERNYVHDVAHNGVQFLWSVIDSDGSYGFSPSEIKTGDIVVKDNVFEDVCQLTTDCGALKFWGQPPDNHVYRAVLVIGNVFRDNVAWSYVSKQRADAGWWVGGQACQVQGQAGFGLYIDCASGIHAHRNIAYNNAYAGFMLAGRWRDGDIILHNNVAANSLYGFRLSGLAADDHGGSVNTQIRNNIVYSNEGYGIYQSTANAGYGNLTIDHNLYYNNGWRSFADGGVWMPGAMAIRTPEGEVHYQTLGAIQGHADKWETHGVSGNPEFRQCNPDDHNPHDGSWPDFHLTAESTIAIDNGGSLPSSLTALLEAFSVEDLEVGEAYDIGRFEASHAVSVTPSTHAIQPRESATYTVHAVFLNSLAPPARLETSSPHPGLHVDLMPLTVDADTQALLTTTDVGAGPGSYSIPITMTGGAFTEAVSVDLLVASGRIHLPVTLRWWRNPSISTATPHDLSIPASNGARHARGRRR